MSLEKATERRQSLLAATGVADLSTEYVTDTLRDSDDTAVAE
jgi:hypothetical protein